MRLKKITPSQRKQVDDILPSSSVSAVVKATSVVATVTKETTVSPRGSLVLVISSLVFELPRAYVQIRATDSDNTEYTGLKGADDDRSEHD